MGGYYKVGEMIHLLLTYISLTKKVWKSEWKNYIALNFKVEMRRETTAI